MKFQLTRTFLLLLCSLSMTSLMAQDFEPFKINGSHKTGSEKAYLMYYPIGGTPTVIDSALINQTNFSFSGRIEGPSYAGILFGNDYKTASANWQDNHNIWFTLFKGNTNINFETAKPLVTGGNEGLDAIAKYNQLKTDKLNAFNSAEFKDSQAQVLEKLGELKAIDAVLYNQLIKTNGQLAAIQALNTTNKLAQEKLTEIVALSNKMESKFGRMDQVEYATLVDYIQKYPDNEYSLYKLKEYIGSKSDYEQMNLLFEKLNDTLKNSNVGRQLKQSINSLKIQVGTQALDFEQEDTEGNLIKLSDFKGKYLLIDFWASWCVPCRAENPHLVAAYAAFKDKNFEILAVSLDDKKDNWLEAIRKDGLSWVQVSDLKGWKNNAATLYGIRAIPSNILIDPTGKIIAKNLRGDELNAFLTKTIN